MDYEKAMEVIQKICDKLNVAAGYLIPKLAAYKITENAVLLTISAAVLFCMVKLVRFCFKEMVNREISDSYDGWPEIFLAIGCFGLLFAALLAANAAIELATWIAAPEVKGIEYVINLVK